MANNWFFRLLNGHLKPDIQFDHTNIPTADQKSALAGEGTPSGSNKFTTNSYVTGLVNALEWQNSVQYSLSYVKAGVPSGTATNGEQALNTSNNKVYTYSSGWGSGVDLVSGDRLLFAMTGSDTSGDSGTYTPDDKIRSFNGTTISEITPTEGFALWDEYRDALYLFNGTGWVLFGSTITHNNLASLQGGTSGQYYHLTADQRGAVNSATTPSASNPVLTNADRSMTPTQYLLPYWGFVPSQTNQVILDIAGFVAGYVMPKAGSIVAMVCSKNSADAAGSLTAKPTINGTAPTQTDLNCTVTGNSGESSDYHSVAPGTTGFTFAAGDKVGSLFTSNGSWTLGGDLSVTLFVVFNS